MSEKAIVEKTLDKNMVTVKLTLYKPFYDFIKEYLTFFGSKYPVEDFCRETVYREVQLLHQELQSFISDPNAYRHAEKDCWNNKWMHIAITSTPDNPEDGKES
ncbi:hypothetical protein KAU88_07885 [Candidatus Bathyarchaeota archaeon]|nr:hypothetical protein [Candidatus Bathyarchaeota archaeon]